MGTRTRATSAKRTRAPKLLHGSILLRCWRDKRSLSEAGRVLGFKDGTFVWQLENRKKAPGTRASLMKLQEGAGIPMDAWQLPVPSDAEFDAAVKAAGIVERAS